MDTGTADAAALIQVHTSRSGNTRPFAEGSPMSKKLRKKEQEMLASGARIHSIVMPPGRTKERLEGNLKKAVESFIEWLILGLAVCSTERIQKYCSLK